MDETLHIGELIRDLRHQRHITGGELGIKAGLSQSKISKIETGSDTNIRPETLEAILNILDAPQIIRQRVLTLFGQPETLRVRRYRNEQPYELSLEHVRQATLTRVFTMNLIPALLQTIEYREALLKHFALTETTHQLAMRSTIKRQDLLWDTNRHFHFILHESAFYSVPGSRAIQMGQLDRLDRFIGLPNVKLGIIALQTGLEPVDCTTFALYDERQLALVMAYGDLLSNDTSDIAVYLKLFRGLDRRADYGDTARTLIGKAMSYFS